MATAECHWTRERERDSRKRTLQYINWRDNLRIYTTDLQKGEGEMNVVAWNHAASDFQLSYTDL